MAIKKKNIPVSKPGKSTGEKYTSKKALPKSGSGARLLSKGQSRKTVLNEPGPSYSISSRIRPIGNSKGVILPGRVIDEAGISPDAELIIQVFDGVILIAEAESPGGVNTDLSSWEEQFRKAIKMGKKPETDLWEGVQNRFDEEEWS